MKTTDRIVTSLRARPLIAILRGVPERCIAPLGVALAEGGVTNIEVTFTDHDAARKLVLLRRALPDSVCVGAGTVTKQGRLEAALEAGAEFVVTPHVVPAVNALALQSGVPVVCGAMTPTEIAQGLEQGCRFIKLFPAAPLGPAYLKALFGPYPELEVFVVGGIGRGNLEAFMRAGALGAGIGGSLTDLDWENPDYAVVTSLATDLLAMIRDPYFRRLA